MDTFTKWREGTAAETEKPETVATAMGASDMKTNMKRMRTAAEKRGGALSLDNLMREQTKLSPEARGELDALVRFVMGQNVGWGHTMQGRMKDPREV